MAYERDILDEFAETAAADRLPGRSRSASGMVVEDRASGFCGDVVQVDVRGA